MPELLFARLLVLVGVLDNGRVLGKCVDFEFSGGEAGYFENVVEFCRLCCS